MRREGTYGEPPRPRLRCFYTGEDGKTHKHGLRPPPKPVGVWDELPGSHYGIEEVATALVDLARGTTYTEASRRIQVNHGWDDLDGLGAAPEAAAMSGATVAGWLDRFGPVIAAEYAEREWPQSLICDSTEFGWTNPRTGDKQQMFAVLAAWGYPAGARRGRLWALAAAPSDDKEAWKAFFDRLPGRPEIVVYDSDKAIHSAVRQKWPTVPRVSDGLCEGLVSLLNRRHLLIVAALNAGASAATLAAIPILGLPGASVTLQDLLTRHFTGPPVSNPWWQLVVRNFHFWPSWLVTPSISLAMLLCSVAGAIALSVWRRDLMWFALGLAAAGFAQVAAHPLMSEAPRLGLLMWMPAVFGGAVLAHFLRHLVHHNRTSSSPAALQ